MATSIHPPLHLCESCERPATGVCGSCRGAPAFNEPAGAKITRYCSPACAIRDWAWHGELCFRLQNRKRLYRAGELLQRMMYIFREKLEIWRLVKVEENNEGKLSFTVGERENGDSRVFCPFPTDIFQTIEDKHSVLAHMFCEYSVTVMHECLKHVLSDMADEIWETRIYVGNRAARDTVLIIEKNNLNEDTQYQTWHKISKITLADSAETFVIDLTAAQYGWQDGPIYPEHAYIETRCERDGELDGQGALKLPFGATKELEWRKYEHGFLLQGSKFLVGALKYWETEHNKRVVEVLQAPRAEFDSLVEEVINRIDSQLDRFKNAWEESRRRLARQGSNGDIRAW